MHRVFPSRCFFPVSAPGVPNSLVYCKRTVWKSLSRYMHVGTYPTRNFSYLRTSQGYGCQVVWAICLFLFIFQYIKIPIHLFKPVAGFRHYISNFMFQRPVFLLNSRSHVFSVTHFNKKTVLHIPKLPSNFAELNLLQYSTKTLHYSCSPPVAVYDTVFHIIIITHRQSLGTV